MGIFPSKGGYVPAIDTEVPGFGLSPETSYRRTFLSIPGDSTGQAVDQAHHVLIMLGLKIITSKMEDWMQWSFCVSIGTPVLSF